MHCIILTDINGCIGIGRNAGAYRIATELRNSGYNVDVIDFIMDFSMTGLLDLIKYKKRKDTKFVGFSSTFLLNPNYDTINDQKKETNIKYLNKNESSIGYSIEDAQYIVDQINDMNIKVLIGGQKIKKDLNNVVWIEGQGETYFNKNFNYTTDGYIRWEDSDLVFEEEHLPIEIARGCIFKCSYCNYYLNGKKLWDFCRSPKSVYDEMIDNYDKFGTVGYMFCDDTYNDSIEKISQFNEQFSKLPFDLKFSTFARADLIISKPEQLDILIDSGLKSVFFGVETLNHKAGKFAGKGMHPDKMKRGLEWMKEKYPELIITIGMIAGLPFETKESLEETLDWADTTKVDNISFNVFQLTEGSMIQKNPEKFGYSVNSDGVWKNEHMDYYEALEYAKKGHFVKNKGFFHFYNRMHNIGFTEEELKTLNFKKDSGRIVNRKKIMVDIYKKHLMNL